MTQITITGAIELPDGSFPINKSIVYTLQTRNLFAGGSYINRSQVESLISDSDGSHSTSLHVPDDPELSAKYHYRLPDQVSGYFYLSQSSPVDLETIITTAVDATEYAVVALDGYLTKNVNTVSVTAAHTISESDNGKIIECDGTFTITFPDGLGPVQGVVANVGSGAISMVAATELQSKDGKVTLAEQFAAISFYHRGGDVWLIFGDLS